MDGRASAALVGIGPTLADLQCLDGRAVGRVTLSDVDALERDIIRFIGTYYEPRHDML